MCRHSWSLPGRSGGWRDNLTSVSSGLADWLELSTPAKFDLELIKVEKSAWFWIITPRFWG